MLVVCACLAEDDLPQLLMELGCWYTICHYVFASYSLPYAYVSTDQTKATVYAIDRDPAAIMLANKLRDSCDDYRERLHPVSGHFGDMIKLLKKKGLK